MKIATSLSQQGIDEVKAECAKVCNDNMAYVDAFIDEINNKLDINVNDPRKTIEIGGYFTKSGNPHLIDIIGDEYFNWIDN